MPDSTQKPPNGSRPSEDDIPGPDNRVLEPDNGVAETDLTPFRIFDPGLEASLLGSVLVNPEHVKLLRDVLGVLTPRHRTIAEAMLALADADKPPDLALLRAELGNAWADVGGHAYLGELMAGVPKSANAPYYAEALRTAGARQTAARTLVSASESLLGGDRISLASELVEAATDVLRDAAGPAEPLSALDLEEILDKPPIDPPWIIPKWLAAGDRVVFAAQSGFGKSYVLLDLALALTTGAAFLGIDPIGEAQRVTIVDEENPTEQDARRLQYLMRGRDIDRRAARATPLRVIVDQNVRFRALAIDRLRRELDEHPTDWLFLDSMVRFLEGRDESASGDMSAWFSEALDPLRRDYGIGIVVLHHIRKPGQGAFQGGGGDPLHAVRGSGDIGAWPDSVWCGVRDGKARTIQVAKSRWASEGAIMAIDLEEEHGASRLVACEQDLSGEQFVAGRLAVVCEDGMLRQELIDEFEEHTECSADAAKRTVGRAIAKMRGRGAIVDKKEGRASRYFLAGMMKE